MLAYHMWHRFGTLPHEIYALREEELLVLAAFFSLSLEEI